MRADEEMDSRADEVRQDTHLREQTEAVQRMQDYIRTHLNETITPADLARASLFSPWYSMRLFRELTAFSPADYIRRLKLSHSALRLRDERCRVTDVAFDMGFGSVDGYQRAFRREFGCNPSEYAEHPIPLYLFTPYGVQYSKRKKGKNVAENVQTLFVQLIEKPARKALIKRGVQAADYFAYCEEVGCEVWGLLTSMKSLDGEPVSLWLPETYRAPGTSEYVQGVEVPVEYADEIPEGFDVLLLPKAQYLLFRGEPFEEADYGEAIENVWKAMESYDPSFLGYAWDDENPRIQLEPRGTRGYIELRPVKQLGE